MNRADPGPVHVPAPIPGTPVRRNFLTKIRAAFGKTTGPMTRGIGLIPGLSGQIRPDSGTWGSVSA